MVEQLQGRVAWLIIPSWRELHSSRADAAAPRVYRGTLDLETLFPNLTLKVE